MLSSAPAPGKICLARSRIAPGNRALFMTAISTAVVRFKMTETANLPIR